MSLTPEEIRKSFESFEKRKKEGSIKLNHKSDYLISVEKTERIFFKIKVVFFSLCFLSFFYWIISNSDKEIVYISSCEIISTKYQKAYYSKYSFVHDEYDNWSEVVSNINTTKTINGELLTTNDINVYKNNLGYYSSSVPNISYLEKEDGFDNYKAIVETDFKVMFEDGREYHRSGRDFYKTCVEHYLNEKGLEVQTFDGAVTSI